MKVKEQAQPNHSAELNSTRTSNFKINSPRINPSRIGL
jgi:hypothetical protein